MAEIKPPKVEMLRLDGIHAVKRSKDTTPPLKNPMSHNDKEFYKKFKEIHDQLRPYPPACQLPHYPCTRPHTDTWLPYIPTNPYPSPFYVGDPPIKQPFFSIQSALGTNGVDALHKFDATAHLKLDL